ncbi:MAG: hypothetical protein M3Z32_06240, partial [Acidobacteriota bacterium]|nr:hypothetical protein [Acidobacteriota bacterium]
MRRIPWAALLLLLSAAHITCCLRYAWAGMLADNDTVAALHRATQLEPQNAAYFSRLAALDPEHQAVWLETALKLHPTDAVLWIERGVHQEISGDPEAAEADLLEAARRDHQYVPRWTLAAFYFRQHHVAKFQAAARQALEMAWGDALPLFQMAAQLGMTLDDVRRTMLPDRAPVLAAFVSECLRRNNLEETLRTTRRLVEIGAPDDRSTALAPIDALFRAGQTGGAVELWNRLADRHWIPHPAIHPAALIPNPDFSLPFLPAGFDWHPSIVDGVVFWRLGAGHGLQVEISGRQPESCTLLTLPLPLNAARKYALHIQASGVPAGAGLKWKLGT